MVFDTPISAIMAPNTSPKHIVRGKVRFFDHILVSGHFSVEDAGFWHDCREDGTSDPSAAWARLSVAQ
jgi:hypothetical protein